MKEIKYFDTEQLKQFFMTLELYREYGRLEEKKNTYRIAVRNEALFHVMYYCALRVSEVTRIKLTSYNPLTGTLYCERLKNGISNTIKLNGYTNKLLKKHLKINDPKTYLFETKENRAIQRASVDTAMKKYCKFTNLPTDLAHCHTLRHSRAIQLAESGCDLKELQYWLGHREISNTMIYFSFTYTQQMSLYKKINKNENKVYPQG